MKQTFLFIAATLFGLAAYSQTGLIAHWDFNGESNDVSGHGHTGHAVNTIDTVGISGSSHTAYYFDGTTSIVTASYAPDLNLTKYTIFAVIKPTGLYQGACLTNTIFSRGVVNNAVGVYNLWFTNVVNECFTTDSTQESFGSEAGTNTAMPSLAAFDYSPYITKNSWYKIVCTYDSTSWRIYVNGILHTTVAGPSIPIGISTDSICMGMSTYDAAHGFPYNFKGFIDDIQLYNRALTDTEAIHLSDTCGTITAQPSNVRAHILGSTVNYTVGTTMVGASYQWQQNSGTGFVNLSNAGVYSGVTTPTLTITGVTSTLNNYLYRCIISTSAFCVDTSNSASLVMAVGVPNVIRSEEVTMYPNPATDEVTIHSTGAPIREVAIINLVGQTIKMERYDAEKIMINVADLPAGLYLIKINGSVVKQFRKQAGS